MPKRESPIISSRSDDPELRDEIDEFVIELAERIDMIQDALCSSDLELLESRCAMLAEACQRLGFSALSDAAKATMAAARDGKPDVAEAGVVEITRLGQRIRLGHRGAT